MDDELWALIEPLLPPWPQRAPGPKPVDDPLCLRGILYVLCNDISWQLLPLELRSGSGQTC
ncbi:transposase [Streptomyces sp. NL15-2K]|uniref:transposase n=1 Tax=Streptomyces sp. NL15-2K TaxID=376149 RepID=UPI000FFAF020|nr:MULTISPECIES: transposase [Actinomycetes]WKX06129.1 transposase [Kutzneria buriramensis]GCB42819.1 mobile element protein [Streptomyces sp. NL15-2K]